MSKLNKFTIIIFLLSLLFPLFSYSVVAQTGCSGLFEEFQDSPLAKICEIGDVIVNGPGEYVINLISAFIVILIFANFGFVVYEILKGALIYVRAEGNEEKIRKAREAIKTALIGVAFLIIGIFTLIIITTLFSTASLSELINRLFECFSNQCN